MSEVRLEDAPETAKALRKECDNCSCFKDPFMCGLGPCQNIKAADLLDAQAARIAELEGENAKYEAEIVKLIDANKYLEVSKETTNELFRAHLEECTRERNWAVQNVARHCATCKHYILAPSKGSCESAFEPDCALGDVECIETIDGPSKWECRLDCAESTEGACGNATD